MCSNNRIESPTTLQMRRLRFTCRCSLSRFLPDLDCGNSIGTSAVRCDLAAISADAIRGDADLGTDAIRLGRHVETDARSLRGLQRLDRSGLDPVEAAMRGNRQLHATARDIAARL